MACRIKEAVEEMGPGALSEGAITASVRPFFARTLARGGVYLASHTLGRPLDQAQEDIAEGASAWAEQLRDAWAPWLAEEARYRAALAKLLGVSESNRVVPKASAGQALRAVLNALPWGATVLTTDAEFTSVAVILAQFHARGRLRVVRSGATLDEVWNALLRETSTRLVVVSQVFYSDGRVFGGLPQLARACRAAGAELLVDCYHGLGVLPFSMEELGCSYLIGGCYKYLRGGPGAAFLALSRDAAGTPPLDIGWFALQDEAEIWGTHGPSLREGGDGWLEATPAVLPYYAARAGLELTAALGIERLRAYSLGQLVLLKKLLEACGIAAEGGDTSHGAFLTVATPHADALVRGLAAESIVVDARQDRLRICPDVLTTADELERTAAVLARLWRSQ